MACEGAPGLGLEAARRLWACMQFLHYPGRITDVDSVSEDTGYRFTIHDREIFHRLSHFLQLQGHLKYDIAPEAVAYQAIRSVRLDRLDLIEAIRGNFRESRAFGSGRADSGRLQPVAWLIGTERTQDR